jgi:hypothetical protein
MGLFSRLFGHRDHRTDEETAAVNEKHAQNSSRTAPQSSPSQSVSVGIFPKWPDAVSNELEQLYRIRRAATENISIVSYSSGDGNAIIRGNSGAAYTTSLEGCTCEDFQKRGLPCKHMYVLAQYLRRVSLSSIANANADKIKAFAQSSNLKIDDQSDGTKWEIFDVPQGDSMALRKYEAQYYKERTNGRYIYKPRLVTYGDHPEQAFQAMLKEGQHILPGSIQEAPYDRPTQAQLYHAIRVDEIDIPRCCCRKDLSCIIDKAEDPEYTPADPELKQFCERHRIPYSLYEGESNLMADAFNMLGSDKEKVAFQIAARVYEIRKSWNFQNWEKYLESADSLLTENEKFKSSYLNNQLAEPSPHSLIGREIRRVVDESY